MAYIRDDIPHRRRHDFEDIEKSPVETIILEEMIRSETWLFICPYNPDNKYKHVCCDDIDVLLHVSHSHPPRVIYVLGDLNINALSDSDFKCLKDVMDIHDLHNVIDSPTCFKSENKSLLDIILTSNKRRVAHTLNVNTGISDFHNLIAFSTKFQIPKTGNKYISVRMREVDNQTNPLSVSFSIYPYPIQQGLLNMELPWGQYNQVPDGIGYSYPTCEFSEILNDFVWLLQHVSHDCTLAIRDHAGPPDRPSGTWVACLVNTSKWCGHDVFPAQWVNLWISWRLWK